MKTVIWFGTIAVFAVWSVLSWGAHLLLGMAGRLASSNADVLPVNPETVELVSWLALLGQGVGEWLIIAVWAVVSLLILGAGFVANRLLARGKPSGDQRPPVSAA